MIQWTNNKYNKYLRVLDALSGELTLFNSFASLLKGILLYKERICSHIEQILSI